MTEIIFTKQYERWKKTDLFAVATETLPKVDKNKVLDKLRKMRSQY